MADDEQLQHLGLEDFVAGALAQVAAGVAKGKVAAARNGVKVSPPGYWRDGAIHPADDESSYSYQLISEMVFDLAVTIDSGTKTAGRIAVLGGFLGLASSGQSEDAKSMISRISFKVPISFAGARERNDD